MQYAGLVDVLHAVLLGPISPPLQSSQQGLEAFNLKLPKGADDQGPARLLLVVGVGLHPLRSRRTEGHIEVVDGGHKVLLLWPCCRIIGLLGHWPPIALPSLVLQVPLAGACGSRELDGEVSAFRQKGVLRGRDGGGSSGSRSPARNQCLGSLRVDLLGVSPGPLPGNHSCAHLDAVQGLAPGVRLYFRATRVKAS